MTAFHFLEDISDTARAVAISRALESERPDALFKDPFARRLAGVRGEKLLGLIRVTNPNGWGLALRTVLLDDIVRRAVKEGVDTVMNLAAGLDSRPYRMGELPASLRWIEVDLPGILDEKEQVLVGEKPVCRLERIRLDLSDAQKRREVFERVGRESRSVLVLTEGLLMYLQPDDVKGLARDLLAQPTFQLWGTDLPSPLMTKSIDMLFGKLLERANARLRFTPSEGVSFFLPLGWKPVEVHSILREAARARRLSLMARLLTRISESDRPNNRPWYAICLFQRSQT